MQCHRAGTRQCRSGACCQTINSQAFFSCLFFKKKKSICFDTSARLVTMPPFQPFFFLSFFGKDADALLPFMCQSSFSLLVVVSEISTRFLLSTHARFLSTEGLDVPFCIRNTPPSRPLSSTALASRNNLPCPCLWRSLCQ